MTLLFICDACKQQKDKKKLFRLVGYAKTEGTKSGTKARIKIDICSICLKKIGVAVELPPNPQAKA